MDARTWPLSVAATQLLLDLQAERPPRTTNAALLKLAVKELILRGALHVDAVTRRKRRKVQLDVSAADPSVPLPGAAKLTAARIGRPSHADLRKLIKDTLRSHRLLPDQVRAAAERELRERGLTMPAQRKVLGVFRQHYLAPTLSGEAWQRAAAAFLEQADALVDAAPAGGARPEQISALGPLVLLSPGGLALAARSAARQRAAAAQQGPPAPGSAVPARRTTVDSTVTDWPGDRDDHSAGAGDTAPPGVPLIPVGVGLDGYTDAEPFSALDGLGDALGSLLDHALSGIDTAIDSIDSAIGSLDDAIGSIDGAIDSIDSAIDGGVSDGGGDGGGGDGGGGGD